MAFDPTLTDKVKGSSYREYSEDTFVESEVKIRLSRVKVNLGLSDT